MFLAETFSVFDEGFIECWNDHCKKSDGLCEAFDRRRALQVFNAQRKVREDCMSGSIINMQSSQHLTLSELAASQQADISITHFWLLNRAWSLCFSHGLLHTISSHAELRYSYACQIAIALWAICKILPFEAMEVHGVGLAEKIYDVTVGVLTALRFNESLTLQTDLAVLLTDPALGDVSMIDEMVPDIRSLLQSFSALLNAFRGGDHNYGTLLQNTLSTMES